MLLNGSSNVNARVRPAQTRCPAKLPIRRMVQGGHCPKAVAQPRVGTVSTLAAQMKPFAGCNCYYLLSKAIYGEQEYVRRTLQFIKDKGFNVIRIWAFNDGEGSGKLQTAPGVLDPSALNAFDWLVNEVESVGGLQLMMTLTNCLPDYGGMQQYVSWANKDTSTSGYPERFKFYTNTRAQQYYKDYVQLIVNRYKGRSCIHSWDICNEPRNAQDAPSEDIKKWVDAAAGWVKSLDSNHPVTVGSEGFFGPASEGNGGVDWRDKNPYNGNEGCNWLAEAASANLDFVCIHPYADQWRPNDTPPGWLTFNKGWLDCHIEACKTQLGGKPLVIQEYNMPAAAGTPLRLELYDYVKNALLADGPLVGAMVWMVALDGYPNDRYTLYPSTNSPEFDSLSAMCREVNNKPQPS